MWFRAWGSGQDSTALDETWALGQASNKPLYAFALLWMSYSLSFGDSDTGHNTMSLTRWAFVGKVRSLLFNKLSKLVIAFLPRSNCLLTRYFICLMCFKITEVGIKNPCFPDEESETQKAPPRSPSSRADMHTQVGLTISLMVSFISKCLSRDLPSFTLFLSLLVFPYLLR